MGILLRAKRDEVKKNVMISSPNGRIWATRSWISRTCGISPKTTWICASRNWVNGGFIVICHRTWDLRMKNDSKWSPEVGH